MIDGPCQQRQIKKTQNKSLETKLPLVLYGQTLEVLYILLSSQDRPGGCGGHGNLYHYTQENVFVHLTVV